MKRRFLIKILFQISAFSVFSLVSPTYADLTFQQVSGIKDARTSCLKISPNNSGAIFVGTQKALYKSDDSGLGWQGVPGIKFGVNHIEMDKSANVFVATEKGLFLGQGNKWNRIYGGQSITQHNVTAIGVDENNKRLIIGTKEGAFYSQDSGKTWHKISGIDDAEFTAIAVDLQGVYAASTKGLFKIGADLNNLEKIFVISRQEETEAEIPEDLDSAEYEELTSSSNRINAIFISGEPEKKIYLATQKGIYMSGDAKTWQRFSEDGLLSRNIKDIQADSKGHLYAATDKGSFFFDTVASRWFALYKGIETNDINALAFDNSGNLWLATGHGLFKSRAPVSEIAKDYNRFVLAQNIPGISEIQREAIQYAEVYPDKIKSWRQAAAKKAILPRVTVGADRYATNLYHWDSGSNPDVLMKGRDAISWDVSLSWDLGDLIWNSYQKDIDVRSRLMVQLRNDILDEVTRIYFERKRLFLELKKSAGRSQEKELRLEELTANLDALTGGYFSRKLEEMSNNNLRDRQNAKYR